MSPATPAGGRSGSGEVSNAVPVDHDNGVPLGDMAELNIRDEQSVEVKTEASGSYTMTATRGKGYSPSTERYSPPFVRNLPLTEDPFVSTPRGLPSTPKSTIIMGKKNWRSRSNSSGDDSVSTSLVNFRSDVTARKLTFGNEQSVSRVSDRQLATYADVDPEDAQGVYPPEWCVFVANLLQSETDGNLAAAVHQLFSEYGKVYVKIRRDGKLMPFGFCQYTNLEDTQNALRDARGRLVCGRPCRVEMAKAERFYLIERMTGPVLTTEEAKKILAPYGKVKTCYPASPLERTALRLNEGVLVSFEMYDMGQTALQALRSHGEYKMQNISGPGSPLHNFNQRDTISTPSRAYLDRVDVDNLSIFVGNLPVGVAEHEIEELFGRYGTIDKITIKDVMSKYEPEERVYFAFVQFRSGITADTIVERGGPFSLGGQTLRVAHKISEKRPSGRGAYSRGPVIAYHSPTRRRIQGYPSPNSPSDYRSQPEYRSSSYPPNAYGSPAYGTPAYASPAYPSPPYSTPPGYYPPGPLPQYGYPHGYAGSYGYYPAPYSPGAQAYYPPPYNYSYQSPNFDPYSPVISDASSSPTTASYWGGYAYPPPQFWSGSTTVQQAPAPTTPHPVTQSSPTESNEEPEDRSATPTPSRLSPAAEESVEVQQ